MHDVSTIDPRDLDSVEELQAYCDDQAAAILEWCRERDVKIACAESLTGGLLADAFVRIPGASQVLLGSAVTYDIHAKASVLGAPTGGHRDGPAHGTTVQPIGISLSDNRIIHHRGGWTGA